MSVREAELSLLRRVGASDYDILGTQGNLANAYQALGRKEQALSTRREVYSGRLRLQGEEHIETCLAAENYALSLIFLKRHTEAKSVLRKTIPVVQRVRGKNDLVTLKMRWCLAMALYTDPGATLDELREAVNTLAETEPSVRRVLGGAHPHTVGIEQSLRESRAALRARETPSPGGSA